MVTLQRMQCGCGIATPMQRRQPRPSSQLLPGQQRTACSSRGVPAQECRRLSIDCCSNEGGPQQKEKRTDNHQSVGSRHVGKDLLKTTIADVGRQYDRVITVLTPKQEGDVMDVVLCSVSMMVFVYTAMQLYRLYAWSYYMAGFHTFAEMLN